MINSKYNKEDLEKLLEGHINAYNHSELHAQQDFHEKKIRSYALMYESLTGKPYVNEKGLIKLPPYEG